MLRIKAYLKLYSEIKKKNVPMSIIDTRSRFYKAAVNGIKDELVTPKFAADVVVRNVYARINEKLGSPL